MKLSDDAMRFGMRLILLIGFTVGGGTAVLDGWRSWLTLTGLLMLLVCLLTLRDLLRATRDTGEKS